MVHLTDLAAKKYLSKDTGGLYEGDIRIYTNFIRCNDDCVDYPF